MMVFFQIRLARLALDFQVLGQGFPEQLRMRIQRQVNTRPGKLLAFVFH